MNAELVSVGTELLLGQIVDTNAQYLAARLAALGINVYFKTTVGDNADRLRDALRIALGRADVVITTGGLGPTEDDLTKEQVAWVMGEPMEQRCEARQHVESYFARLGREMPESNLRQTTFPKGALLVPNPVGTAPGMILEKGGKMVICLPGVPPEMRRMMEDTVLPYLARIRGDASALGVILSRVVRTAGAGESTVAEMVGDLLRAPTANPTVAPLIHGAEVHLRLTARAQTAEEASALLDTSEAVVRKRLGDLVFGIDDQTLESVVCSTLAARGLTVAVAESCTGGLILDRLTDVPGASAVVTAGVTSYSNRSKVELLGCDPQALNAYGAVSPQVALQMAAGVRARASSSIGLSTTGIAGPTGGSPRKPVGLVYVACVGLGAARLARLLFGGTRRQVKERAACYALDILRRFAWDHSDHPDHHSGGSDHAGPPPEGSSLTTAPFDS